jgi:hypothetical protein
VQVPLGISLFFLRFILWSVADLAGFRALRSTDFAIIEIVNIIFWQDEDVAALAALED